MSLRKNRNFAILLSGQLVSTVGNNLFFIALPWYVYAITGSKSALALTGLAQTLPSIVGLFAGVMVDRWSKKGTMIVSDFIRTLLSLILFVIVLMHGPLSVVLVVVLAMQVVGQFFNPASGALFPLLVNREDIASGSGVMQSSNATAQLAGTLGGGAFMAAFGAPFLFLFNSISFLVSVISLFFIRISERTGSASSSTSSSASSAASKTASSSASSRAERKQHVIKSFFQEWLEGISLITRSKYLVLIMISALITNSALAPFDITMTAWVKGPMSGNAFDLGLINGGFFVGIIVGGLLLGKISQWIPQRALLIAGLVSIGLSTAAFGLSKISVFEIILAMVGGFSAGCLNGSLSASFIRLIPEQMRGRIFGLIAALSTIAAPVGMAVFGTVMVHVPLQWVFALIGGICVLSGCSLLLPVRDDKELLAGLSPSVEG